MTTLKQQQYLAKANDKRVLKFMRAQVVLSSYFFKTDNSFETGTFLKICLTEKRLYEVLSKIGYVWSPSARLWRLDKRLGEPRQVSIWSL